MDDIAILSTGTKFHFGFPENRIFIQGAQILVEDLNSTNYTYVNQQRLTPGQPHPLNDGDELRFGRVKLAYHSA